MFPYRSSGIPSIPSPRGLEQQAPATYLHRPTAGLRCFAAVVVAANNDKQDAEKALWDALEERRERLRAEKLWTGRTEQQHRKLAAAYDDGRLIDALVEAMERRARTSEHSPVHLSQMAKVIKAGYPIWEQILIEPNKPWSRYFSGRLVREGAEGAIADAKAWAEWN